MSPPLVRLERRRLVRWIDASHNPEVAGSNPAPLLPKAPETALWRLWVRSGLGNFGRLSRA
jgi:hypothetical protein